MSIHDQLETLSAKELRKLRMTLNNRLEKFKSDPDCKDLPSSHRLHGLSRGECEKLLTKVKAQEKNLSKNLKNDEE